MEAFSAASAGVTLVLAVGKLSSANYKAFFDTLQATKKAERSLLARNYGSLVATLVTVIAPEIATQYRQIDAEVLHGGEQETVAFRQAITDESNMTAVAVSPQPIFVYPNLLLIADGRAPSLRKWQSQH